MVLTKPCDHDKVDPPHGMRFEPWTSTIFASIAKNPSERVVPQMCVKRTRLLSLDQKWFRDWCVGKVLCGNSAWRNPTSKMAFIAILALLKLVGNEVPLATLSRSYVTMNGERLT